MPSSDIRGGMTFDAFFTGIYLHALPGQVEVEVPTQTNAREAASDGAQARMSAASGASARVSRRGVCVRRGWRADHPQDEADRRRSLGRYAYVLGRRVPLRARQILVSGGAFLDVGAGFNLRLSCSG